MRRGRGLRDQSFDAPEALPDQGENSDTEDRPKSEETTDNNADNADELFAKAEVSPGIDEGGLGKETFLGRDAALDKDGNVVTGTGSARVRKGSSRPPEISPELWRTSTPNKRRKLLKAARPN